MGCSNERNHVFCESTIAGQYATLICGRAGASGEIEIGSAGHFPALLIEKNGVRKISSTGLPLGMFAKSQYTIDRLHLGPGDSLVLYTDGISEAANSTVRNTVLRGSCAWRESATDGSRKNCWRLV